MNIDNLNKLITHLENEVSEDKFDMMHYAIKTQACGTVMCITGHAAILSGWATLDGETFKPTPATPVKVHCYTSGDVNPEDATELWLGAQWPIGGSPFHNDSIETPQQAAQVMADIRDTYLRGEIHPRYPHDTKH